MKTSRLIRIVNLIEAHFPGCHINLGDGSLEVETSFPVTEDTLDTIPGSDNDTIFSWDSKTEGCKMYSFSVRPR